MWISRQLASFARQKSDLENLASKNLQRRINQAFVTRKISPRCAGIDEDWTMLTVAIGRRGAISGLQCLM